jgi:hypothetical protein
VAGQIGVPQAVTIRMSIYTLLIVVIMHSNATLDASAAPLYCTVFPEQREGRRVGGLGGGKLGPLVPAPQDVAPQATDFFKRRTSKSVPPRNNW